MTKELLHRYICGETTQQECEQIEHWLLQSDHNMTYYAELKNLITKETMPQTRASAEELYEFHNKLEAERKSRTLRFVRRVTIAFGSAAAAIILALYLLIPQKDNKSVALENLIRVELSDIPKEYVHTLYTEYGVKAKVILPDGSTVLLNSGSKISYPDKFIGDTREITFHGEGYFNVVADSLKPMIVKTNHNLDVMVLGTEFNLRTFDSTKIETTLYSGKISLITGDDATGRTSCTEVMPNTKTYVSPKGVVSVQQMDNNVNTVTKAWTKGRLIFDSTPLDVVIKELERWHGIRVIVTDPSILKYKITADFNSESAVQIADLIRQSARIDYRFEDKVLYLSGR
ncbi:MAG: DUF4974 domain-containing protein [Bacteroidales bacterium]|nr:DUF4974 domain-containing protein [Bacteroidales bacterium]